MCTGPPASRDVVGHPSSGPPRTGTGRPTDSDALLVAAGRGDLDAFAAFYDATAPWLTGVIHRLVDRPDRTDGLTAEIYLTAQRHAPSFDPVARSAEATLLRLVRRALVGVLHRRDRADEPPERTDPVRLDDHPSRQENS